MNWQLYAIGAVIWILACAILLLAHCAASERNKLYDDQTDEYFDELKRRGEWLPVMIAILLAVSVVRDAKAQDWRQGDHLMLNVRSTIACTMAPLAREWHRMLEDGRPADAFRFAITYCGKMVWAPVPLIVLHEDDMTGEANPAVCVRQINWEGCVWIAREYLMAFDPGVTSAPAPFVRQRPVPTE